MPAAAAATEYAPADYAAGPRSTAVVQQLLAAAHQQASAGDGPDSSSPACGFRSAPVAADHEAFVRDAVRLMLEQAVFRGTDRRRPVLNWKGPEELRAAFDFRLGRSASTHGHLLRLIEDTVEHSVKTGHPYFVNQLFSRRVGRNAGFRPIPPAIVCESIWGFCLYFYPPPKSTINRPVCT